MPQRVRGDRFHDLRLARSHRDRTRERLLVVVVPTHDARARIDRDVVLREDPVPSPELAGARILLLERIRQRDPRAPPRAIALETTRDRSSALRISSNSEAGTIVTRSLPPLPSRTTSSRRSKLKSFTRTATHSPILMPVPYMSRAMTAC